MGSPGWRNALAVIGCSRIGSLQDSLQSLLSIGLCTAYMIEIERGQSSGVRGSDAGPCGLLAPDLDPSQSTVPLSHQPTTAGDALISDLIAVANGLIVVDFLWQLFLSRSAYAIASRARHRRLTAALTTRIRSRSPHFLTSTHAAVDLVSILPFVVTTAVGDDVFTKEGTVLSLFPTLRLVPILRVHRVVPHLPSGPSGACNVPSAPQIAPRPTHSVAQSCRGSAPVW